MGSGESLDDPITHGGVDRGGKFCRCCSCGLVARSTPHRDFFTMAGEPNGELRCEMCALDKMREEHPDVCFSHEPEDDGGKDDDRR